MTLPFQMRPLLDASNRELDSTDRRGSIWPRAARLTIVRSGVGAASSAWTAGDSSGESVSRFACERFVTDQAREHLVRVLDCATVRSWTIGDCELVREDPDRRAGDRWVRTSAPGESYLASRVSSGMAGPRARVAACADEGQPTRLGA